MRRIDANTVELESDDEEAAVRFFHTCLDNGLGIHDAVARVHACRRFINLDPELFKVMAS